MRLIAELHMPGVASWNGRWSGESDKFTVNVQTTPKKKQELIGYYTYRWEDGWMASVTIREPLPREKVTGKFCGYEWMVDSIKKHGKIIS